MGEAWAVKLCPRCHSVASYNSYFGAYICSKCRWRDESPGRARQAMYMLLFYGSNLERRLRIEKLASMLPGDDLSGETKTWTSRSVLMPEEESPHGPLEPPACHRDDPQPRVAQRSEAKSVAIALKRSAITGE